MEKLEKLEKLERLEKLETFEVEVEISYECICCGKTILEENFTKFKGLYCSRLCLEEYDELGSYDSLAYVG